jgi:hypothetical protein
MALQFKFKSGKTNLITPSPLVGEGGDEGEQVLVK